MTPDLYGWDEEQMWPTIAAKLRREHPGTAARRLSGMEHGDPRLANEYVTRLGDPLANTYRGARACAAAPSKIKIWHYGSKTPGDYLFLGRDDADVNPHPRASTGRTNRGVVALVQDRRKVVHERPSTAARLTTSTRTSIT